MENLQINITQQEDGYGRTKPNEVQVEMSFSNYSSPIELELYDGIVTVETKQKYSQNKKDKMESLAKYLEERFIDFI